MRQTIKRCMFFGAVCVSSMLTLMDVFASDNHVSQNSIEQTYAEHGLDICFPDSFETLSLDQIQTMIQTVQSNGSILWDDDAVDAVITSIYTKHISGCDRILFRTKQNEFVSIPQKGAIWRTDPISTRWIVKQAIVNKQSVVLPHLTRMDDSSASCIYKSDFYIEVSTKEQHMWVHDSNRIAFESEITTGKARHETNKGVFSILKKQRNRTLRGPGYAAFVNYWMKFNTASEGFHDASWRNEFGTNTYLSDGSHGCVNMPSKKAKLLYDVVEIGTPVIVY